MGKFKSLVLVVLVLALLPAVVSAGGARTMVSVDSYTVQAGQEFTVPVRIVGVSNLYGADVRLTYNPAVLQGVRVDHGGFLQPGFVVRQGFYGPPQCNPMCARYALTQLNPTPPASGSGVLMHVTFRAVAPGASSLALRAELATRNGVLIPVNVDHGVVKIIDAGSEQ